VTSLTPRLCVLLLYSATSSVVVAAELTPVEIATVDAVARDEQESQQLVGLAIGVIRGGETAYLAGYGWADREQRQEVTQETVFNWASNSKPLGAVIAMQLVESGWLDLDADVRNYVPEFPDPGVVITTRHLLCHQSGIPHYRNGVIVPTPRTYDTAWPFLDPLRSLDKFRASPLIFSPGERMEYSSYAYVLLSAVLQRAGDEPYGEQVRRRISAPLKMQSLQLDLPRRRTDWAVGYERRDDAIVPAIDNAEYWKHAAGGYKSSVEDFARWACGLLGDELLTERSKSEMWTAQTTNDGEATRFGLGFIIANDADRWQVSHSGSQSETRTQMAIYPRESLGVVVMCNTNHADTPRIGAAVLGALAGQPVE